MVEVFTLMDSKQQAVPTIYTELAHTLHGDVDTTYETLQHNSRDNSPCVVMPHILVYPKTISDIKKCIACAEQYHIPLAVKGSGLNASGAALVGGILIDTTKYLHQIRTTDMPGNTITVDPGVTCKKIRTHLGAWGLEVPFLTEQDDEATIGGIVATKNVSPASFESGGIRSWILGISVMLHNGEEHMIEDGITPSGELLAIYQQLFPLLGKESATLRGGKPFSQEEATGYNIWTHNIGPRQLIDNIVGSQGTLAVITGIKLRTTLKPAHTQTLLITLPTYTQLPTVVEISKHHGVRSLHMYDSTLEQINSKHPVSKGEHALTVVATLAGNDAHTLHQAVDRYSKAISLPEVSVIIADAHYSDAPFTNYEHMRSALTSYAQGSFIPSFTTTGLLVPISSLGKVLEEIDAYHAAKRLMYCVSGNPGSGHISVITLIPETPASFPEKVIETTKDLFLIIKKYNGGIGAVSGDGLVGTPFLPLFYSETIRNIFTQVKQIWDPHNIFNPGKKQDLTLNYVQDRITLEN